MLCRSGSTGAHGQGSKSRFVLEFRTTKPRYRDKATSDKWCVEYTTAKPSRREFSIKSRDSCHDAYVETALNQRRPRPPTLSGLILLFPGGSQKRFPKCVLEHTNPCGVDTVALRLSSRNRRLEFAACLYRDRESAHGRVIQAPTVMPLCNRHYVYFRHGGLFSDVTDAACLDAFPARTLM